MPIMPDSNNCVNDTKSGRSDERGISLPVSVAQGTGGSIAPANPETLLPVVVNASSTSSTGINTDSSATTLTSSTKKMSSFARIFAKVFGHQSKPSVVPKKSAVGNVDNVDNSPAMIATSGNDKQRTQLPVEKTNAASESTKKRKGKTRKHKHNVIENLRKKKKVVEETETATNTAVSMSMSTSAGSVTAVQADCELPIVDAVTVTTGTNTASTSSTTGTNSTTGTGKTTAVTTSGPEITDVVTERQLKHDSPIKKAYRPISSAELCNRRQQIQDAVLVVTHTLRHCTYPALFMNHVTVNADTDTGSAIDTDTNKNNVSLWPSPFRSLNGKAVVHDVQPQQQQQRMTTNTTAQHFTHMSSVCASIEKFTNDIIMPAIMGEVNHALISKRKKQKSKNTSNVYDPANSSLRAFFGTLLLLREMLIQNINTIFGPSVTMSLIPNDRNDNHYTTSASITNNDTTTHSLKFVALSEVQEFEKQIFVTSIILSGLQSATINSIKNSNDSLSVESLMDAFLHCMDLYDRGHQDFFVCLLVNPNEDPNKNINNSNETTGINMNPSIRTTFPNSQYLNDREHMAWTVSCNYQRTMHPIYVHAINRIEQFKRKQRQYIYNTINCVHVDHDDAAGNSVPAPPTVGVILDDEHLLAPPVCLNSNTIPTQHNKRRMKVIVPKTTAVHISILKIQEKM